MLLFTNLVLGVISRVAQQMNIFAIGFPITLGVGLVGVLLTLPLMETPFTMALERMLAHFQAPTTKGSFTAVVSFGDSLSDIGAYAPATSLAGNGTPPFFGGKFTTNETSNGQPDANPLGKVWVENLAASLGILVTPAEVGFGASSVKCPAAANPAFATTCTGYGQGGSRVTDPNGIGHSTGALTVPVVTQIANHLARFGSFKDSDLILVYAGNNDVFTQFDAFAATAAQVQADAAAGKLSADQANLALFAAQQSGAGGDEGRRAGAGRRHHDADPGQGRHLRRGDDAQRHRRHAVRQFTAECYRPSRC